MRPLLLVLIATLFSVNLYSQKADTTDKMYTTPVQGMPRYRGGEDGLRFRLEHIRYLFEDRVKSIEGKVLVAFVVEKDGTVTNVKMLHGLSQEQDKEVMRVVNNLRKFKPG